jgi:ribonuclease HI
VTAAIEGLRALNRSWRVTLVTDSEYVRRGITEYLARWKANGGTSSVGKRVPNRDLWEELEKLVRYHGVNWCHVRGHSGVSDQGRCDAGLATAAAVRVKRAGAYCDAS